MKIYELRRVWEDKYNRGVKTDDGAVSRELRVLPRSVMVRSI